MKESILYSALGVGASLRARIFNANLFVNDQAGVASAPPAMGGEIVGLGLKFSRSLALLVMMSGVIPVAAIGQSVMTFDSLSNQPAQNSYSFFATANGGNTTLAGVTFDTRLVVCGDQYVEAFNNTGGSTPFLRSHSGHYAIFNANGSDALTLTTTRLLLGAWFSRPDYGNGVGGATNITVNAMQGAIVLASASIPLAGESMIWLDTSVFTNHAKQITSYRIDRIAATGPYGGGGFVADDFTFYVPTAADLVIASLAFPKTNQVAMSWASLGAPYQYTVEWSTNLTSAAWSPVSPTNQWPISTNTWLGPISAGAPSAFYRVRAQ
jgi:hypothetical protein